MFKKIIFKAKNLEQDEQISAGKNSISLAHIFKIEFESPLFAVAFQTRSFFYFCSTKTQNRAHV